MCNAFSCIVTKDRRILQHSNPLVHSHQSMIIEHRLQEARSLSFQQWLRVECRPKLISTNDFRDYNTEPSDWEVVLDEHEVPIWYKDDESSFQSLVRQAATLWWRKHVKNGCYRTLEVNAFTGKIEVESYFKNDSRHRTKGPAIIRYWNNGKKSGECYYINGEQRRKSGPSEIDWYRNGTKMFLNYRQRGSLHREHGPAILEFYPNGTLKRKCFYLKGSRNRKNGPAQIEYYTNGSKMLEIYCQNDKYHRLNNQPAMLKYSRKGKIIEATYWFKGNLTGYADSIQLKKLNKNK